jgi:hypothetical protein
MSAAFGAGLGALGGAAGFAGGKLATKLAQKFAPTLAKDIFGSISQRVDAGLFKIGSRIESKLYAGAYKVVSRLNPGTEMLNPVARDIPSEFAQLDAIANGQAFAPWASKGYLAKTLEGLAEEGLGRSYEGLVAYQVGQLQSFAS